MKPALGLAAAILCLLLLPAITLDAQQKKDGAKGSEVTGFVYDVSGEPLPGALVVAVTPGGDKLTATTDINGVFSITCPPDSHLEFHYLGYEDLVMDLPQNGKVEAVMKTDADMALDEAVVIGYGSVKKADLTGSVTSVKMSEVRDVPVASIDKALQGRIAGADIMSTTGAPGATTSIRIRGTRSINASNEPLIVVDGVMDAVTDLNDLNSADIDDIVVLKDASSTAIYGSRGSNGVILITTKSGVGTDGKPNISLKADVGVSMLPSMLDIMDAKEFSLYRNDYQYHNTKAMTLENPLSDYNNSDPLAAGAGSDWIRAVTRLALYQNYNLSLNMGNKKTNNYVSIGYNDTQGIIKKSGQKKLTARYNVDHQLFKWMKVGYKMNYTFIHIDETLASIGGTGYTNSAQYMSPLMGLMDSYNPLEDEDENVRINPPTALIAQNTYYTNRHTTTHTVYSKIDFTKHLYARVQFSYFLLNRSRYRYYPSTLPKKVEGEGGEAYRAEYNQHKENFEATLTYENSWKKRHNFDAVIGFTSSMSRTNNFSLSGSGYLVDANKWNNMNAISDKENYSASSSTTRLVTESVLARFNYNYKKRYYFTFTGRADAASNFAADHKWGFFPSGAFKWNISKEPFMKKVKAVDELSVRLSAGRTGNNAISAYTSLGVLGTTTGGYIFNGSQPVAYYPSRINSPQLTWEKTDTYNAAVQGTFLNNRLSFVLEGYYSRTSDLLLSVQTAGQTGYTSRYANAGITTNKGVEFTVESRNIVKKNFTWSTTLTLSHNSQMVEDIATGDYVVAYKSPGNNAFMMYGYKAGYPLNALWGFQYAGVWHNEEEITRNAVTHTYASATTALTKTLGAARYLDVDHNGVVGTEDLRYLGNADPVIYGGLQNSFQLGNWNFSVYFTYSLGGKIYNFSEIFMASGQKTNQYRYMLEGWHPVRNPESNYPAAGLEGKDLLPSSFMVHDASYIRLQDVTVGYTLPLKSKYIKDIAFSITGNNLYLWKKYNGFDPDVSSSSDTSTIRRADIGAYPKSRTVIFSIQLRY